MNVILQKILAGQNVSAEDKLQIARTLVAEKVAQILEQKVAIAMLSGDQKIRLDLTANECTDSDQSISLFLKVLGMEEVKVTSDFPGYNETYMGRTSIQFRSPRK